MNIQGLAPKTVKSKVSYIGEILLQKDQLFIGLSETWLNSSLDSEISIPGYILHFAVIQTNSEIQEEEENALVVYVYI